MGSEAGKQVGDLFSHPLCSNGQLALSWPAETVREHQLLLWHLAEPFQHLAVQPSVVNARAAKQKREEPALWELD